MTQSNTASGPENPRVVVDSDALEIVRDVFGELAVETVPEEPHAHLRLTRMTVGIGPDESVDALLAEVRRRIAQQHGGWTPAMGKDREAFSPTTTGGYSNIMSHGPSPIPYRGGYSCPMTLRPTRPSGRFAEAMALEGGAGPFPIDPPTVDPIASDAFDPPAGGGVRIGWIDTPRVDLTIPPGQQRAAWEGHCVFVRDLIRQAAPNAEEPELRGVLNREGGRGDLWDVAVAMVDLVLNKGVDILLLPLATYTVDGLPPLLFNRALEAIGDRALVIAAAGNQLAKKEWKGDRCSTSSAWPAAYPWVRAVGALFDGRPSPLPTWVDAFTPGANFEARFFIGDVTIGEDTATTHFEGGASWAGTSFSAAHAAGLVAGRMAVDGITAAQAWASVLGDEQLPAVPDLP